MNRFKIAFWFGTEAEVIKTFPVILELRKKGFPPFVIASGQNDLSKSAVVQDWDLYPDLTINQFTAKKIPAFLLFWFATTFFKSIIVMNRFTKKNNIKYLVVHGDTVSTLMGALVGYLLKLKIIHLEAGLRSFNLFNPFPEEIDRIIVGKLSSVHFYQNEDAGKNLSHYKGERIHTYGNVVYDTVDLFKDSKSHLLSRLNKNFSIVTFHRAEHVLSEEKLKALVDVLILSASKMQTLFVLFDFTKVYLEKYNLLHIIMSNPNIVVTPRVPYKEFCVLMAKCSYIVTDGGSNQEELAHLGIPTLIMRMVTERVDGIDRNVVLSRFDKNIINNFLSNYQKFNFEGMQQNSPSKIVSEKLLEYVK